MFTAIICLSQKVAKRLHENNLQIYEAAETEPILHWRLDLVKIGYEFFTLLINTSSTYMIVIPGFGKKNLESEIKKRISVHIGDSNLTLQYAKMNDKHILESINDNIKMMKYAIEDFPEIGQSIVRLEHQVNINPLRYFKYKNPTEMFLQVKAEFAAKQGRGQSG